MHIYKITNTSNGKVYIGQTIQRNPKIRWYAHLADARRGKKSYLLDSIRKYGKESFVWETIDSASSIEELNTKEEHWLNFYRARGITVYNNREAGSNKTHSPESIEKMRAAQKLRHATTNVGGWKRQDGGAMKGKKHPGKGKPHAKRWSEEMKLAHSIRCKKREEQKRQLAKEN
jgi:group I intron endonuclease